MGIAFSVMNILAPVFNIVDINYFYDASTINDLYDFNSRIFDPTSYFVVGTICVKQLGGLLQIDVVNERRQRRRPVEAYHHEIDLRCLLGRDA